VNGPREHSTSARPPQRSARIAGWIFVSLLLAIATLLSAVGDRPLALTVALAIATVISAVAGAVGRPDRKAAADDTDRPATGEAPTPPDPPASRRSR
jgi:low temperature requirement protein LtrA